MTGYQIGNIDTSLPDANVTGQSGGQKLATWFGDKDYAQEYQNALTQNNREYEKALLQEQMNYETWYDATAVQRRVADIKAAGLNPWLALQNGGIAANGSSGSVNSPGSGSSAASKTRKENGVASLAMLLLSTAKILALL